MTELLNIRYDRRYTVDGLPIWVWPRALPKELCDELIAHPRWPKNEKRLSGRNVVVDERECWAIGRRIAEHVDFTPVAGAALFCGVAPMLTFGRDTEPAPPHLDRFYQDTRFKLLVYLNEPGDGSGGTKFYDRQDETRHVTTRCELGTVILFDVGIWHRGQPQPKDWVKLTLGLRPRFL